MLYKLFEGGTWRDDMCEKARQILVFIMGAGIVDRYLVGM